MSTASILVCALVLDAVFGEPRWLWSRVPHPATIMGKAVAALDRKWNSNGGTRQQGCIALAFLVAGAAAIGWLISLFGPIASILGCAVLLAQKSLVQHVQAVADGLRQSDASGRDAVALIVSRDVTESTGSDIGRAAIESLSENFSDGVIAPAFWFLIGGLPGIMVYKVVNTADSMIGYLTPRHAAFGWAAARLDDVLNWVPARLTALLIAIIGQCVSSWSSIARDAGQHRSPNAGWPEAAMARVLSIALAGPRNYHGTTEDFAWVNGAGRKKITPPDIDAAITVIWEAWGGAILITLFVGGISWVF